MRLSIDPGLNGTGWALWKDGDWLRMCRPFDVGVLHDKRKGDWTERALRLARAVRDLHERNYVEVMYVEYPQYFDSAGGNMVAKRGDLLKLTYLVGLLAGITSPSLTILVPVNQWKGQLPKDLVARRIREKLGTLACATYHTHIWDAVGIGLYAKGHFK